MQFLAIPYPKINPVALDLGLFSVKWYGLAYVAGLLLGWTYIRWLLAQKQLWPRSLPPFAQRDADDLLIYVAAGVLIGGRLGHVIFYDPLHYLASPLDILAVWKGGMAFHGGLVGCIVGIVLFARRVGANPWSVLDSCAAAVPIGLFFGRLANFVNGELWGRPTSVPWAMVFPARAAGGLERHPSQLYEAFFEGLVLFALLWWLSHRLQALRRPGVVAGTFLVGYGLARSFCEFYREPDPGHILTLGPFTAGMLYSIPMIVAGIWILFYAVRRTPAVADASTPS
ncbi:MAG: prolipoprotein diacylglyceryl transferase [Hyphomicrobiaceae bacterium]|nr:prolipoprotein diacylglyceryl transferase [Hyphomicrobiaceae bacterium]